MADDISQYTTVFRARLNPELHRKVTKRNRPAVSCTACRARKQKCDRQLPCGACTRRGDSETCRYSAAPAAAVGAGAGTGAGMSAAGGALPSAGAAAGAPRQEAQLRLQRLEEMVNGLIERSRQVAAEGGAPMETEMPTPPDQAPLNGDGSPDSLRTPAAEQATETPSSYSSSWSSGARKGSKEPGRGCSQQLNNLIGVPVLGATHWAAMLESIHDIQSYLEAAEADQGHAAPPHEPPVSSAEGQNHQPADPGQPGAGEPDSEPEQSPPTDGTPDIIFATAAAGSESLTISEVLAALPPRAECDRLLAVYFQLRYAAGPFIHTPQFQRTYGAFWRDPRAMSFLWVSILCSVLSMAAVMIEYKRVVGTEPGLEHSVSPRRLRAMAVRCLIAGEYLRARPLSVEALVLVGFTRMSQNPDANPALWSTFCVAARLAQRMGYHRDARRLHGLTPFEAEMRRRTWYLVEAFDVLYSFQLGVPPIVHEEDTDAEPPTNLLDEDFDEDSPVLPPARPLTDPTPVLYYIIKSRSMRLLRRVLRHAMRHAGGGEPDAAEVASRDALAAELRTAHAGVPPSLRLAAHVRDSPFTDAPYQTVHRLIIELIHLKATCVLHRRSLTTSGSGGGEGDGGHEASRQACRGAALRILVLHAEYEEEGRPGGRLAGENSRINSLTLHEFLLAATILCLDLTESVSLSPDERARELAALRGAHRSATMWRHTSRDASHAARILGAIAKRLSAREREEREVAEAAAEAEAQAEAAAAEAQAQAQAQMAQAAEAAAAGAQAAPVSASGSAISFFSLPSDFSLQDWGDHCVPFDDVLNDPNNLDWNLVDSYLLDRRRDMQLSNELDVNGYLWSADLMSEGNEQR